MANPEKHMHLVPSFELSEFRAGRRNQVVAKCGYLFSPTHFFGSDKKTTRPACPDCFYHPQFAIAA